MYEFMLVLRLLTKTGRYYISIHEIDRQSIQSSFFARQLKEGIDYLSIIR